MSSIYLHPAIHEGHEKITVGGTGERRIMLQPAGGDLVWGDGRGFMETHDHHRFVPKELLLFHSASHSDRYPCPVFFSQHDHHHDQDEVPLQHTTAGGLGDRTTCDRGMSMDDSLSKPHMSNSHHDHQNDYSLQGHDDHRRRCERHRHNHQDQQRLSRECNSYSNPVRTCVDCNTTKTPLWRSGPLGPKSLCNACGIRHHKARRARAAASEAAAQTGENYYSSPAKSKLKKEKRADEPKSAANYKKRSKIFTAPRRKKNLCLDIDLNCEIGDDGLQYPETPKTLDFPVEMSKPVPFKRVFPEDEEQAAILLMALSCGLVHG